MRLYYFIGLCFIFSLAAVSCASMRKIDSIRNEEVAVNLAMTPNPAASPYEVPIDSPAGDTLIVKGADGREIFILKAVKDEKTGEMVANDVIEAACVTATFRNVAERDGKVALSFRITVPQVLLDSKWQIRFIPSLQFPDRKMNLDAVVITGKNYRKAQILGYQRYEKFLETIISDSTKFIDKMMLDRFIRRYIPDLYAFKNDSTAVTDEQFASAYGVTAKEALTHYTDHFSIRRNEARKARKSEMFRKYVKVPIERDGIRIDTLIAGAEEPFVYDYEQLVDASPGMRKISVKISGGLWEEDRRIYSIPMEDSITFYISSLSSLLEEKERYLTEIVSRRVAANVSYDLKFPVGSHEICTDLADNEAELGRLKENIMEILTGEKYELDSIVVTATSSPDGPISLNRRLSQNRSQAIIGFIRKTLNTTADSLRLICRTLPEDWQTLEEMVANDGNLGNMEKQDFSRRMKISDPDKREMAIRGDSYYSYIKEKLYPKLRVVRMDFQMHRRGMVKDTIWTTVIDTAYMNGLKALRSGDYQTASLVLHNYGDFNSALAYCALNRNHTALSILEGMDSTAKTDYLRAIIYARLGDEQKAVQHYLSACSVSSSFMHRGNLDPEISSLIRKYNLNGFQ